MPNYKETEVTGAQWQRCSVVHIDNPYGNQPLITFAEEVVATLGTDTFIKPSTQIVFPFNPADQINLQDPTTGAPIGTMSAAQVYVALYSFYIQKALERDTAEAEEVARLEAAAVALALAEAARLAEFNQQPVEP